MLLALTLLCFHCRATEFILLLLKRLHDDKNVTLSIAASEVYYQTLNKYHTWYTTAAFTVVLKVRTSVTVQCFLTFQTELQSECLAFLCSNKA